MDATRQIPIEFLHGVGQTPQVWDPVVSHLPAWADAAAPTIPSVSAPRHEPFTLEGAAKWVAADLIDRTEEDAVVAGLSLGALIAIKLAAIEPGLVKGLVLSAPLARAPKALMSMQRLLLGVLPERAISGPSITEGGAGLKKSDVLEIYEHLADVDLRATLHQIQVPTLVLVGGNDRANRRSAGEVVESMPDATMQVIPGVGHEWNRTHPDRFAAAVAGWMESRGLV